MPGTQSINVEFSRNLSRNRSFPLLGYALAACLFLMGVGTGCTWFKDKPELSAEDNYLKGMAEYKDKDYKDAIPYFQKILENYPFSIHAIPAELKIAECYYYDEKYLEALVHLQGFEELHPTNDQIPYVIWMKAVSFYEQFSSIDRDIAPLENARQELEELRIRFPASTYAHQAEPLLEKVLKRLARHDFYVARFYYQDAEYQAALGRFYSILGKYRVQGVRDRAMYYIGKCHFFLRDKEQARGVFQELLRIYPESPYAPHAKDFLKDIEQGRFTIVSRYFRLKEHLFKYIGYE